MAQLTMVDFRNGLDDMLNAARNAGHRRVRIISLDLHNKMGASNRMPMACNAMYQKQKSIGGKIIHKPKSGFSSTLEIEYPLK